MFALAKFLLLNVTRFLHCIWN